MSAHIRLLSHAALEVDSRRARSRQKKVGASEIGVCRRRAGYSHHGTQVSDPENVGSLKAVAGTWYHHGALDTAKRAWGALIETTVEDGLLRGHVDSIELPAAWREAAGLPPTLDPPDVIEVDDLKTRDDARAIDYVRIRGPKRSELYQVHLYADLLRRGHVGPLTGRVKLQEKALRQAMTVMGDPDEYGLPVQRIRLRYMPRTGHENAEYVHEQDFDPVIAAEAWRWVEEVAKSEHPDDLPRDQDGPGLSVVCDNCPFATACWGEPVDGVKPQAQLIVEDADLVEALREYDEGRALVNTGEQMKKAARARLDQTPAAIYVAGEEAFKLGWSGGRPIPEVTTEEPDVEAMLALFAEAGITVPTKPVTTGGGTTSRSIGVVPWERPDPACGKPVGEQKPWLEKPGSLAWLQDRPRGGWTGYGKLEVTVDKEYGERATVSDPVEEITAGAFAKRFPSYVEERPPCILKPKHSGDHQDESALVALEPDWSTDEDDETPGADLSA
jgi:hypothetical protein